MPKPAPFQSCRATPCLLAKRHRSPAAVALGLPRVCYQRAEIRSFGRCAWKGADRLPKRGGQHLHHVARAASTAKNRGHAGGRIWEPSCPCNHRRASRRQLFSRVQERWCGNSAKAVTGSHGRVKLKCSYLSSPHEKPLAGGILGDVPRCANVRRCEHPRLGPMTAFGREAETLVRGPERPLSQPALLEGDVPDRRRSSRSSG